MKQKNEQWIEHIKQRLVDHTVPVGNDDWERLVHNLPDMPDTSRYTTNHSLIPLRRWRSAVAAAALIVVAFTATWWLVGRAPEMPALPSQPAYHHTTITAQTQQPTVDPADLPTPAYTGQIKRHTVASFVTEDTVLMAATIETTEDSTTEAESTDENAVTESVASPRRINLAAADASFTDTPRQRHRRKTGWSVAIAFGNGGSTSGSSGITGNSSMMDGYNFIGINELIDLSTTSTPMVTIPAGQNVVFDRGIPYIMEQEQTISDAHHCQPVSVGLSVRKQLSKGFSLETGLTYTFLSSELEYRGRSTPVDQKLHYLGIPLRANWDFFSHNHFTAYIAAGGMVEKCVYGEIDGYKATVAPLQFSIMGAVGAQVNMSRRLAIYAEPGISYYFDDGAAILTIRKERPLNFNLQAGLRLTY